MERAILYINRSEYTPESNNKTKEEIYYSDKETLLKVIEALMSSNDALRKYIEILEKHN